jgi:ADP-ribose pyrophosphatase YjhB (NUDIX family)
MPIERLVGGVVYAREKDDLYFALVHDIFGHWTLSKGGIPEDEDLKEGVVRKIKEEIGLTVAVEDELGMNEYIASNPEKGKTRKQVHYFLVKTPHDDIKLAEKGGLDDARWFKVTEILELNFYEDILPIVTKAVTMLISRK